MLTTALVWPLLLEAVALGGQMAITSVRCPVLGAHVTRVIDLEGSVIRVICAEYDQSTGTCQLKKAVSDGGPLAQLLERTAEETLSSRSTLCDLRAA